MDVQPSSRYREKAAELRAVAERIFSLTVKNDLQRSAQAYENLADQLDRIFDTPKSGDGVGEKNS